ncbi:MAG: hypothetical protein AAGJ83_05820, partial [Planctomycetota bacterium]
MSLKQTIGRTFGLVFVPNRLSVIRQKRRALLRLLCIAEQEGLPTSKLVNHLASECGGIYGLKLKRLAAWLDGGSQLGVALEQTDGILDES